MGQADVWARPMPKFGQAWGRASRGLGLPGPQQEVNMPQHFREVRLHVAEGSGGEFQQKNQQKPIDLTPLGGMGLD